MINLESKPNLIFSFSEAIIILKTGNKVCRSGWNGKGMWLCLVKPAIPDHLPFIQMKTADNKYVPWLASQTDILANDWMIVD